MKENSISGDSKLIAEYLGWKYIPSNDLQGLKKPGWYEFSPKTNKKEEATVTTFTYPDGEKTISKVNLNLDFIRYSPKNGWITTDNGYYKYICRNHNDLRFYNSMDALIPAIQNLEKERLEEYLYKWEIGGETYYNFKSLEFNLYGGGGYVDLNLDFDPPMEIISTFDESKTWIQNAFYLVVGTINYVNNLKNEK